MTLQSKIQGCRKRKIVEKCDLTIFPLEFPRVKEVAQQNQHTENKVIKAKRNRWCYKPKNVREKIPKIIIPSFSPLFLSSKNSITTTAIAANLRFRFPVTTLSVVFPLKIHSLCQILLPGSGPVFL